MASPIEPLLPQDELGEIEANLAAGQLRQQAGPTGASAGVWDSVDYATTPAVTAQAFLGEFVKIAGVRYENRQWSWDPENVVRYFQEEPVWATLDAVSVAIPFGKPVVASARIASGGAGVLGKAYKAGRITMKEAKQLAAANNLPFTRFGRFVSNPSSRFITDEYKQLIDEFGGWSQAADFEKQGFLDVLRREYVAEQSLIQTRSAEAIVALRKAGFGGGAESHAANLRFVRSMEAGLTPGAGVDRALRGAFGEQGLAAYEKVWQARAKLGADALDLNLLTPEKALAQDTYWPQLIKDQLKQKLDDAGVNVAQHEDMIGRASYDNFLKRKYDAETFEKKFVREFDPVEGMKSIMASHMAVARERFAKRMLETGLTQSADDLLRHVSDNVVTNTDMLRAWGFTDAAASQFLLRLRDLPRVADGGPVVEEAAAKLLRDTTGWRNLAEVAPDLNLPYGFNHYATMVDPAIQSDLAASFKVLDPKGNVFFGWHQNIMRMFTGGHTAYNPSTHVRNIFGATIFHTLATGVGSLLDGSFMRHGIKMVREGMDNPLYRKAAEEGVTNATFTREFSDVWSEVVGSGKTRTVFDPLYDLMRLPEKGRFRKLLTGGGAKLERFYRNIDEAARLDAWARNYEKFRAANAWRVGASQTLKAGPAEYGYTKHTPPSGPGIGPGAPRGDKIPAKTGARTLDDLAFEGGPVGVDRELDVYRGQRLYGFHPAKPGQIPARTTRPPTLDEARAAGGGPVPPGSVPAPAPPSAVGPARPAGVQDSAVPVPVGPQAVATRPGHAGPSAVVPFEQPGMARGPLGSGKAWTAEELERRARSFATMEVAKYLPSFAMHSRLSNLTRQIVPFSSFSHEAIRVWKNALVEKPHLAYFWEHITDAMSEVSGAVAGYSPEQLEEAYSNLPWYNQGKKMLAWPVAVDGKPAFIDMSYIIPLANVVEAERADTATIGHLVGLAGLDVTSNPLANIAVAGVTGRDVFKQTEIEPRFTERQLGITLEQPTARQAVGLAEHIMGTMLPPLAPFGYAGQNIIEYARGQRHGQTGGPLEQGLARTFASNMLALRFNMADVQSNLLNIGYEDRKRNESTARWWERWAFAVANDRDGDALQAERNLFELQLQAGKSKEDAYKYLIDGVKTREPGAYRNYGKKRLQEAIERSERLGLGEHPTDAGQLAAMRRRTRKSMLQQIREIERGPAGSSGSTQLFKLPEE